MKKLNVLFFSILVLIGCSEHSNQNAFHEVKIGHQIWSDNNLNIDKFRNGEPIPLALSDDEARSEGKNHKPIRMIVSDTTLHVTYYLYNWYAVSDPRGLAPNGWHIPSKDEFYTVISEMKGNLEMELVRLNINNSERWWTTTASNKYDSDATSIEYKKYKNEFVYKNGTDKHKLYLVRCIKDY
jgi:uncharacterized protein (TIGR02145 family)